MIARELITKLSFQVDRRGIENFNRSILGIKTRIGLATSAIGGFVAGVVKATSAVADSILTTADIAKSIGATTSEVNSLVKALSTFRIPTQNTEQALRRIAQSTIEARQGFGELFRLSRSGFIEIRDEAGKMLSPLEILFNLLEAIGKVEDETYRRTLARENLFDERFADVSRNIEQLKAIREQFSLTSDSMDATLKDAEEFSKNWILLMQETSELTRIAFLPLVKFFATFFKGINEEIVRPVQKGTFWKETFKKIGEEARDLDRSLGLENNFGLQSGNPNSGTNNQITMRNNISITVPSGTEQQQIDFIKTGADEAFNESFEKGFERIGTNFPRTE